MNIQSILQAIVRATQPPQGAQPAPGASGASIWAPDPTIAPIPSSLPPPGYGQPQAMPAQAPAAQPGHVRVMDAIKGLFSPEEGSFWNSALHHGLLDAKTGMASDARARQAESMKIDQSIADQSIQDRAAADTHAASVAATKKANDPYSITPTGDILDRSGDVPKVIPGNHAGEQERLIDRWHALNERAQNGDKLAAMEASIVEHAIKGYQYTEPVITAQGNARTRTAVAAKQAQKFAPRAVGSSVGKPGGVKGMSTAEIRAALGAK